MISVNYLRPENIVHHTIKMRMSKAPKDSNSKSHMLFSSLLTLKDCLAKNKNQITVNPTTIIFIVLLTAILASCSSSKHLSTDISSSPPPLPNTEARWIKTDWSALPGFTEDFIGQAWPAWLASCYRRPKPWVQVCQKLPHLTDKSDSEKRLWIQENLDVYRIEDLRGNSKGLLTSYYEPVFLASRQPSDTYKIPLYAPPDNLTTPWFTRQQIETDPIVKNQLKDKAWVWLASPIDTLNLHIQGSGLLQIVDSSQSTIEVVRAAFANSNGRPFYSPMQWLLLQGWSRDVSWPGLARWAKSHPEKVDEVLWKNPRYIFFHEEKPTFTDESIPYTGPKGAVGIPLSAGRSIAIDPASIPYHTPIWLSTQSEVAELNRLVIAQDTGIAINGSVRVDYFAGTGSIAGEFAGKIKQPLYLWAFWPKTSKITSE
jgi:membrane-bound lytic murein transglycosylase A